ncbi:MAG: acyl-CoA thioesterase [Spirochaetota bacterium]
MEAKRVSDSSVTVIQQMMHEDANLYGNVHGGTIMKLVDNTAGIVGVRHSGRQMVTASIDRLDFHSPVFVGDLLRITASANYVGSSSMEIGVRIEAEDYKTGKVRHTASAYMTFVALDERGKPVKIPSLEIVTEEERRRNKEAAERRKNRLEEKGNEI